nr:HIRA-interacting protein 3 [Taeniopygia guttata]
MTKKLTKNSKFESEEEEDEDEEEEKAPKIARKSPKLPQKSAGSDSEDSEDLPLAKWAEKRRKREREEERGTRKRRRKEEEEEEETWWNPRKDPPEVARMKRYLRAAGWRPNYKRLFRKCRSRREALEALRGALRELGLRGTPSLARCRRLGRRREERAELAALDASNILPARSRRRNAETAPKSPPRSPLPPPDWSRLRGVVDSDSE